MKTLFSVKGRNISLVDEENTIFFLDDKIFLDKFGKQVEISDSLKEEIKKDNDLFYDDSSDDDIWDSDWLENEGLEEKLLSESVEEIEWEIDDGFGKFGFKNRKGDFVIEPQYAYAHEFTCGLAAVNLNRTWYKTKEGHRYYENHFGYINHLGETIIPFAYDEAWQFNKYGVAVVETRMNTYVIDTKGKRIPGTDNIEFSHYYDYDDRFLEFTYKKDENEDEPLVGIYDTKERKILLEPSIDDFIELGEEIILVYERNFEYGYSDFRQYYINSSGEVLYPWLKGKDFAIVERPNEKNYAIVAISNYIELEGNPSSYIKHNDRKYERDFIYGIYSSEEKFILPMEYENIRELSKGIYACYKEGVIYINVLEDGD